MVTDKNVKVQIRPGSLHSLKIDIRVVAVEDEKIIKILGVISSKNSKSAWVRLPVPLWEAFKLLG